MVKIVSGGGFGSNKVVSSNSGGKAEPVSHQASPAGAGQLGAATQFRKEPLEAGKGYNPAPVPPTGIANAQQGPAGAGPGGGGRTIYRSGSQGPTPEAREMPEGRNGFGPEKRGS